MHSRALEWRQPPTVATVPWISPVARGWMQYYGAFNRPALLPLPRRIAAYLVRWPRRKYRGLRRRWTATFRTRWSGADRHPRFFAHWVCMSKPARVW
ncbi:group II intron maturase-specific domain-containing protein [Streptomyces sp. NPDC102283]|uniref:group II intron maturase-specific domain-containing protein n=1 Tax=Streptomyces sp. NPDC102283 TaxID=3366155 RepID=UPI00382620C3